MSDAGALIKIGADNTEATQALNQLGQAMTDVANLGEKRTKAIEDQNKRIEASEKRVASVMNSAARVEAKQLQKDIEDLRNERSKETTKQVETKTTGTTEQIKARGENQLNQTIAQRENNRLQALYRLDQTAFEENEKRKTADYKDQLRVRREEFRKDIRTLGPMSQQWQTAMNASIGRNNAAYMLGMQAQTTGMSPSQLWQQQMNAATARGNAANAAALIPGAFGPQPGGGRGGRGGGNIFTRLLGGGGGGIAGSIASGLAGGLGVGLGGYAIANIAQGIGADVDQATAYERQTVAARNLAGSQAKLNELLAAYATASGNAVNKVTSLSNVTRLMATGFADSAPEIEKFVRATRGASIALGKPQDYVIQETQLAISNTSVKRLDQIGLGITEVNDRIEQLRRTNASWTRETAFQDAVLDLMDQKYGKLTRTIEGQVTGLEAARRAWADMRLEVGQAAKGPADAAGGFWAKFLEGSTAEIVRRIDLYKDLYDMYVNLGRIAGIVPASVRTNADITHMSGTWTDDSQSYVSPSKPKGRTDEQEQLISSLHQRGLELERNYQEQRLAQIENYESQRLSLIQNYGKMMVREEEDFVRQRARGLQDYERSIMSIMRDAQERDAEMRDALAERIADAREKHEERVSDIEKKYQKDREKAWSDHRDRLLKAAGQLDAIAILEERKRWKRENQEREEGRKEALDEAKENLEEQIEEAQKAHEKQLEKARKADADRLAEMAENRRIQLEREDEDRAIRLERAAADHNDQLAEMDRLHAETLAKMDKRFYEESKLFEEELASALYKAGIYIEGVAAKEAAKRKAEEDWLDAMIEKYEGRLRAEKNVYSYDEKTGPNIPLDYGKLLNSTAPLAVSSSLTNTSRNSTLVVNQGAFNIYGAPGQSPTDLANEVEKIVIDLMESY